MDQVITPLSDEVWGLAHAYIVLASLLACVAAVLFRLEFYDMS